MRMRVSTSPKWTVVCLLLGSALFGNGCVGTPPTGATYGAATGVSLDKTVLDMIQDATFEVVVLKPTKDSLSYERALPMDQIPYAIRKDKYYSVGTAFAIAPDRFVSAAHVLSLGANSQYKDYYLRDKGGNIFAIDKILKYSYSRDFVVFSLKRKTARAVYTSNPRPTINDKVYAVGNALGQGVVIRDGLYTSDTPEERDGAWKWMRFSAAASPGNSGGPLLDKDGKLIGVVLRKSENENLNFALPIAEVLKAKDLTAVVDTQIIYKIDNMDMTKMGDFKKEIRLPKSYAELNRELVDQLHQWGMKLMREMFAEQKSRIFPHGAESNTLLHSTYSAVFPHLIAKGKDGQWDAFSPSKTSDADLGHNGLLTYGNIGDAMHLRLRKPDNVPLDKLYQDSKLFLDLALKGLRFTRTIGPEKIVITSLGKAREEYVHTDAYQRKWLVKSWWIEYSDEALTVFALPVPGGYVAMLRAADTAQMAGHIEDMKALTDFAYVSYYGSLAQWREFLARRELLPSALAGIAVDFNYGDYFKYKSRRLSFTYKPELMKITKDSDLQLNFSYFKENSKVIWDVSKVVVGEDKNTSVAYVVTRNQKPHQSLNDNYKSTWDTIVNRKHPYDNESFFNDKRTVIGAVYAENGHPKKLSAVPMLYTVVYATEGKSEQSAIEAKLSKFKQGMQVYEY